jgi:hypothetical protein
VPPETEKPVPLAVTLLRVSTPVPDDVIITLFDVGAFRVIVPNDTLVGLTVIAGDADAAGESSTAKVFDTPPYSAVIVAV